jgi:mono/diheme cytochrome c family protein
VLLLGLSGSVLAEPTEEQLTIGKTIYDRFMGRGCGTCHDIASNPQLTALINAGKLDKSAFETTLKEGKNSMPKAIPDIMKNSAVVKAGYGEDQAVDALYEYIKSKK